MKEGLESASSQAAAWDPSPAAEVPERAGPSSDAIEADKVPAADTNAEKADLASTTGWLWEPVPAGEGEEPSEASPAKEVADFPVVDDKVQMEEKPEAFAQDGAVEKAPVVKSASVCPTAISWIVAESETSEGEVAEVECADMGTCNVEMAKCECFEHYSGDACERSSIPPLEGTEVLDGAEGSEKTRRAYETTVLKTEVHETPVVAAKASEPVVRNNEDAAAATEVVMEPSPAPIATSVCPKAAAVVTLEPVAEGASPLAECSNKGVCNKETAKCECFENYSGDACERLCLGEIPDDLTKEELEQRTIAADAAAEEEAAARAAGRRK